MCGLTEHAVRPVKLNDNLVWVKRLLDLVGLWIGFPVLDGQNLAGVPAQKRLGCQAKAVGYAHSLQDVLDFFACHCSVPFRHRVLTGPGANSVRFSSRCAILLVLRQGLAPVHQGKGGRLPCRCYRSSEDKWGKSPLHHRWTDWRLDKRAEPHRSRA